MTTSSKTFAVRSSATRAAKQAGLTPDQYVIIETEGRFGYALVAPIGAEVEGDVHSYTCPHCHISLENGVGGHGDDVNGKTIKHDQFEYMCLGCGGEFGPAIPAKKAPKAAKKTVAHLDHSTAERPCKKVWFIADEMILANPSVKRKEVIAACLEAGVAFYTARTQYQQWLGVRKEMAEREEAAK